MEPGNFIRRTLLLACTLSLVFAVALMQGCYKQELNKEATHGLGKDPYPKPPRALASKLRILVWPDTILPENKESFERRYGVKLEIDTFSNNDDAYDRVCKNPGRWDLIMLGQYMADRLRREGKLIPHPRINPYIYQYIDATLVDEKADPQMSYFIPFDYAVLGVSFNVAYVAGFPRKWEFLAEHSNNPYLYGRIALPDDMRYAMATIMLFAGLDPNSTDPKDIETAKTLLIANVKTMGIRFVADPDIGAQLMSGKVLLGITWNAEAARTLKSRSECRFLLPEGKVIMAVDGFAIPKDSACPETAALFSEFMLHPYSSLLVTNLTMYPSANLRTMKYVDRFVINGPSCMIPPPEQRLHMQPLVGEDLKRYQDAWTEVKKAELDLGNVKLIPLR